MKNLIADIVVEMQIDIDKEQNTQAIDTLIHLGAGRCSELDDYLALQPHRLLLVEADPLLAEDLNARTAGLTQVQVMCAAVAGQPGPATFHRYSLSEVNSLHSASGLLALFPGLKTVEQLQVEKVSPAKLLQPLQLQANQENRLVIDLPGEELPVLQALEATKLLDLFGQLYLHCGKDSLYKGCEKASHVLCWLKNHGFEPLGENHSLDPDRPCWTLQRNTLQVKNHELQNQVKVLQAQLEQAVDLNEVQSKQISDLHAQIHRLTQDQDAKADLINERQVRIEQLTKARDEQAKLATGQQQQMELLTKAKDEQAKLIFELQAQVEQLTSEREESAKRQKVDNAIKQKLDASAKLVAELQAQVQQLTQERDAHVKLASERQQEIAKLTSARDEQVKLAGDRQDQIDALILSQDEQAHQQKDLKKLNESQKTQIDQLEKEKQQLQYQLTNVKKKNDEVIKTAEDRKQRIEQLEQDIAEKGYRQQLLDEELIKAEAQIELINDLLIREKNF
jgi:hypothetical protein